MRELIQFKWARYGRSRFMYETAVHLSLVTCWTFLAVTDSQTESPTWSSISVTEGVVAAAMCALSGLWAEGIAVREMPKWMSFLRITGLVPAAAGGSMFASGGIDWSAVVAMVLLVALTARNIKNEALQLAAAIPSVAAFNGEYPPRDEDEEKEPVEDDPPAIQLGKAFEQACETHITEAEPLLALLDEAGDDQLAGAKALFDHFDEDTDDRLSKQEYKRYLQAIGLWGGEHSVSGEENYRYRKDDNFDSDYTHKYGRKQKTFEGKAGWLADCEETGCDAEAGITLQAFAVKIYGEYRKGKAVEDYGKAALGRTPEQAKWELANQAAAREQTTVDAASKDLSPRRRQQRYALGVCDYMDDFWCVSRKTSPALPSLALPTLACCPLTSD